MGLFAKATSIRAAKNAYFKESSTWRTAKCVWYRVSGTWRQSWWYNAVLTIQGVGPTYWTYGYDVGSGQGSVSTTYNAVGDHRIGRCLFYESGFAGAPKTSVYFYRTDSGSMASVTATNLIKSVYIVGGAEVLTSAATFTNFGSSCVWEWSGDVFSLKANDGGTLQLQVLGA